MFRQSDLEELVLHEATSMDGIDRDVRPSRRHSPHQRPSVAGRESRRQTIAGTALANRTSRGLDRVVVA